MLRIVIDTNILVSATIIPGSTPAKLIQQWRANRFALITCQAALDEADNVLKRPHIAEKYHISDEKRQSLLSTLREHVILVPGDSISGVIEADPTDDMFIACAIEGGAKYIVSGDKHLLGLRRYESVHIVTAAYFFAACSRCRRVFLP
jgi:putative PIN family toxin of toxin-antitoxin system